MNKLSEPYKQIQLNPPDELILGIKLVAKKKRMRSQEATNFCYSTGMGLSEEASEAWKAEARKEGLLDEFESLKQIRISKVRLLMDLRSKRSSKKYDSFEEFNKVSMDLVRYNGRLAEARLLKSRLEVKGVDVIIEQCLIPNLEELTLRYLFRKKKGSEDVSNPKDKASL